MENIHKVIVIINKKVRHSAVGTVGCCHLEVFVWILSRSQDRVPLMTEHNEEATQKKKGSYLCIFSHWMVLCICLMQALQRYCDPHNATLVTGCHGGRRSGTASSPAASSATRATTEMVECTQSSLEACL